MHQEIKVVVQEAHENGSLGFRDPDKEELDAMRRAAEECEEVDGSSGNDSEES